MERLAGDPFLMVEKDLEIWVCERETAAELQS